MSNDFSRVRTAEDYTAARAASIEDPEAFWAAQAERFTWRRRWDRVLEWEFETPSVKWFIGGRLNITENCLDRHVEAHGDRTALIWEPNDPKEQARRITYAELHDRVCRYANVLKAKGIGKGDRVVVYMPMIPDLVVGVLACARIGAIHSVVFCGFSARSLADRINDAGAKAVLCSDGMFRGPKEMPVKSVVDEALEQCTTVEHVLVSRRVGWDVSMQPGRDTWMANELEHVDATCPAEEMDSEDPLFILYTSGSTGKPKGVVHTIGGYMVYTDYSFRNVFQYEEGQVFWCTADVGWITGHSYITYGPLLAGATQVMFEGVPTFPDASRFWQVCEKHKVTQFYTAPTAIRALMGQGNDFVTKCDLSSLKLLGSVGEPINPEAWNWYNDVVGQGRCPIVDTWWQTETGGHLLTPLPGAHATKPGAAMKPFFGVQPVVLDPQSGEEIHASPTEGVLCIKDSWPGQMRTVWGDHDRFEKTYFSDYKGYYFSGDGCRRDADGDYWITGRVDDVINVSGHRMGTAEVESALVAHAKVAEAAVVGYPHPVKGQGIYCYVTLMNGVEPSDDLVKELRAWVRTEIGPIASPDLIQWAPGLPKTRSGKIMRRILRKIAENDYGALGDTSTLADPSVVDNLIENRKNR